MKKIIQLLILPNNQYINPCIFLLVYFVNAKKHVPCRPSPFPPIHMCICIAYMNHIQDKFNFEFRLWIGVALHHMLYHFISWALIFFFKHKTYKITG